MPTDRSFQVDNARQRERLKALVTRLSDADLERRLGHDWTVADALVHLAFWDLRAITLIDRYDKQGVSPSPIDVHPVNDAVTALGRAATPRAAARLAVEAAETVDRRIEAMADRLIDAVAAAESAFSLARHAHRTEHLDEIEKALR